MARVATHHAHAPTHVCTHARTSPPPCPPADACFPTGYTVRDDMNPFKGACALSGRCTASQGSSQLARATDQDVYTGALVLLPAGTPSGTPGAFLQAELSAPGTVRRVSVKGFGTAPLEVVLIKASWAPAASASMVGFFSSAAGPAACQG